MWWKLSSVRRKPNPFPLVLEGKNKGQLWGPQHGGAAGSFVWLDFITIDRALSSGDMTLNNHKLFRSAYVLNLL